MMNIHYRSIGMIHSPFSEISGMPIQPSAARGVEGKVVIDPELIPGLQDLDGFSHIILLYHFHLAGEPVLLIKPFLDEAQRGLFATRAPNRPNSIGLSVVNLIDICENVLWIRDVDIMDGTPLLDVKPYVPFFDQPNADRIGWLEKAKDQADKKRSDDRFLSSS